LCCADNGWINKEVYLAWFQQFIDGIEHRPLLVLCDGHVSHTTLQVINVARVNNVTVLKLPSHTTQLLQPLDVSVFKSLKSAWNKVLVKHQRATRFSPVSKSDSVNLLSSVWKESVISDAIVNGFRTTGVFPVDRHKYPVEKFSPLQYQSYMAQRSQPTSELQQLHSPSHIFPLNADVPLSVSSPAIPGSSNAAASTGTSVSTSGLQEFFISRCISTRPAPLGQLSLKRKKIQQNAAVITHEMYTEAIEEIDRLAAAKKSVPPTAKRHPKSISSDDTNDSINKEYPMPPPLKKPVPPLKKLVGRPKGSSLIIRSGCQPSTSSSNSDVQHGVIHAKVDDYVLVKFQPVAKKRIPTYYVGYVTAHCPGSNSWTVKCMRRHRASQNQFVFPQQPDIHLYSADDIVCVLSPPKCPPNRSVYHFSNDFSPYLSALR
jgi:hypothetical protein